MNVWLMYRDHDFDLHAPLPADAAALSQDLELDGLFDAMAAGDKFLREVCAHALLSSLRDPQAVSYRQRILADCLAQPATVRALYALAVESIEREKKAWGWMLTHHPEGVLLRSIETLTQFTGMLCRLRQIALEQRAQFHSEGFTRLFDMLVRELGDDYLQSIEQHLRRLRFRSGVSLSAALGEGNTGTGYRLHEPVEGRGAWARRLQQWRERLTAAERSSHVYQVAERDEAGHRALSELRGRGISAVAATLGRSSDHVLSFFATLRVELGFYAGCLNLHERLARKYEPVCMPDVTVAGLPRLSAQGLYEVCLSLQVEQRVVGNELDADGTQLLVITGANRGGKSTFLRALGQAQLMLQAGMFVAARSFRADLRDGLFTHFKREEDRGMRSGKLDEELARMSGIVDRLTANSMVLFNESFASTNEREGSEIARQIVTALLEAGVKVVYVTHLFDLAQRFYGTKMWAASFLQAERLADGRRTFRLVPGEPLPTSYGADLYDRIFGRTPADVRA